MSENDGFYEELSSMRDKCKELEEENRLLKNKIAHASTSANESYKRAGEVYIILSKPIGHEIREH